MADALCGPSNALQNFQKHSQVDRTLQQDRLVSRLVSSQGFRSHQPNAGILDPEFAAFEAGQLASPPPPQLNASPFQASQTPRFASPQTLALPDWANDFQRLHISHARPSSSSPASATQEAPIRRHSPQASAAWHQDFIQSQPMGSFNMQQPMFQHQQFPDMSWEYDQAPQFSTVAQGKQPMMEIQQDRWNAEAFTAAFDAATQDALAEADALAAEEAMTEEASLAERTLSAEEEMLTDADVVAMEIQNESEEIARLIALKEASLTRERLSKTGLNHYSALDMSKDLPEYEAWPDDLPHEEGLNQEPIHEALQPEEQAEAEQHSTDAPPVVDEELARTAGQLLDSVAQETSTKFQESVFLQLMRRLRDREVTVEGENFVETGNAGSASQASGRASHIASAFIPNEEQDADMGRFGEEDQMSGGAGEPIDAFAWHGKKAKNFPGTNLVSQRYDRFEQLDLRYGVLRLSKADVDLDAQMAPRHRPLTPDIDPPAPLFDEWRKRLFDNVFNGDLMP